MAKAQRDRKWMKQTNQRRTFLPVSLKGRLIFYISIHNVKKRIRYFNNLSVRFGSWVYIFEKHAHSTNFDPSTKLDFKLEKRDAYYGQKVALFFLH